MLMWGGDPGGEDEDATQGLLRPPTVFTLKISTQVGEHAGRVMDRLREKLKGERACFSFLLHF